ncbi:hypothetical protein UlMin_013411 [Ulmus minor]
MSRFRFNLGSFVNDSRISHERTESPNLPINLDHQANDSGDSSPGYGDSFNATLKFISEILMEEDLERKPSNLQDPLALQAAEKSFYDVLGQKYPPSPEQSQSPGNSSSSPVGSPVDDRLVRESFSKIHLIKRVVGMSEQVGYSLGNGGRGKKNDHRVVGDNLEVEDGRSSKQSAAYADDLEPQEIFDKVLLYEGDGNGSKAGDEYPNRGKLKKKEQAKGSSKSSRSRRKDNKNEMVDLWTLLGQCAQAAANYDQVTAKELLKKIRQHSSQNGDGTQRVAHYFANGLEARLAGSKTPPFTALVSNNMPATDILKGHQIYITACPFLNMSYSYACRKIMKVAQNATRIHIIDFGIQYGFQWPGLIQRLSQRPGGPPKLRITGIELPQPGFRPLERVKETKRRLECYCRRFNVPSEYKVIAQKWETIRYEDLDVDRNELLVVNCMYRMKHIPDETVVANNPRDTVLKLIKRINPDLFIHGVVNGTFNAPFFVTRFKEALFHYSTLFDMFDMNVSRDNRQRMMFEENIYGRDIVNVIACEGLERVDRPETYKQWQIRNTRAGFKQIPLDKEAYNQVKSTVNLNYHKDFVVEQHGQWLLQGWKGRLIYALSCWKSA